MCDGRGSEDPCEMKDKIASEGLIAEADEDVQVVARE